MMMMRGAGSRVVKALGSMARGPGFESRCHRKCWALMEPFVNIYLYEFIIYVKYTCVFVVSVVLLN